MNTAVIFAAVCGGYLIHGFVDLLLGKNSDPDPFPGEDFIIVEDSFKRVVLRSTSWPIDAIVNKMTGLRDRRTVRVTTRCRGEYETFGLNTGINVIDDLILGDPDVVDVMADSDLTIVSVPSGPEPDWVRTAWVGLTIPQRGLTQYQGVSPILQVPGSQPGVSPEKVGYKVYGRLAIEILRQRNLAAAGWWTENCPHVLTGNWIVFEDAVCACAQRPS